MWTQNYLAAPWTKQNVFDQLTTTLTDPLVGWTVFEDRSAEVLPYMIYRNDLGVGRDVLLWVDLTDGTYLPDHITVRTFLFEYQSYTPGSGTFPTRVMHGSAQDLPVTTNLLINHASTPNQKNMYFWFEQGTVVTSPTSLISIEPYTLDDGVTLLNSGDDGTGYPLWGSFHTYWNTNARQGDSSFDREHASFSTYLNESWSSTQGITYIQPEIIQTDSRFNQAFTVYDPYQAHGIRCLHLDTQRSPIDRYYTMFTRGAVFVGYANSSSNRSVPNLPSKRIDAWSGAGALFEGYRPEIITGELVGGTMHSDPRGYLGELDDFVMARNFGGVVGDSFTVDANSYRIIYVSTGTGFNSVNLSLAIRVS